MRSLDLARGIARIAVKLFLLLDCALKAALFFAALSTSEIQSAVERRRNLELFADRWSHYKQTSWKLRLFGDLVSIDSFHTLYT